MRLSFFKVLPISFSEMLKGKTINVNSPLSHTFDEQNQKFSQFKAITDKILTFYFNRPPRKLRCSRMNKDFVIWQGRRRKRADAL